MATKISSIYTLISADDKPMKRGLERARGAAVQGASKIQGALNKINFRAVALGATAMAASIGYATKQFIDLAVEQEAVEKRLAAVLRSTGNAAGFNTEQLKAMAASMQEVTTTGDEVILSGMAILATFKQIRGEAFQRATMAALDLAEVMGQDLNSSIVQIGKALNDPIANLGALGRAGIQFTKDQKETIKSLWEMGRAAEAQNIILTEMESQFGGAAKAARDTFGGAVKSLSNTLGDIGETIGFAVIPQIQEIVDEFSDWLKANDQFLKQDLPGYIKSIGEAASGALRFVGRLGETFDSFVYDKGETTAERQLELLQNQRTELVTNLRQLERLGREDTQRYELLKGQLEFIKLRIENVKAIIANEEKLLRIDQAIAATFKDIDEAAKKTQVTIGAMAGDGGTGGMPKVTEQAKELERALEHLNQRQIERASIWDVEFRHSQQVEGQYEKTTVALRDYTDTATEEVGRLEEAWENSTYTMESSLTQLFTTGKLSASDFVNSVLNDLARLASSKIFQAIGGALFGGGSAPLPFTIRGGEGGGYGFQSGGYIGEPVRGYGMSSGKSYEFHPNEFVLPPDKIGGTNVQVIVHNNTGNNSVQQQETRGPDGSKKFEIWIGERIMNRGPIHKSIQQSFNVQPRGRM